MSTSLRQNTVKYDNSLCGFDNVPGTVVVHMVFTADILTVAMVVMTLGFDFLRKEKETKNNNNNLLRSDCYITLSAL